LHYNGIQGRILVNYRCTNKDINSFIHIFICRSEVLGPNPRAQFEFFVSMSPSVRMYTLTAIFSQKQFLRA